MARADSNDTTAAPPQSRLSRRLALTVLAGSALVGTAAPSVAAAAVDPVFAAIDAHKAAYAGLNRILTENGELEANRAAEQLIAAGHAHEDEAFCALVSVQPTSIGGLIAVLEYARYITQGRFERGAETLVDDEGHEAPWFNFMLGNVQQALQGLSA